MIRYYTMFCAAAVVAALSGVWTIRAQNTAEGMLTEEMSGGATNAPAAAAPAEAAPAAAAPGNEKTLEKVVDEIIGESQAKLAVDAAPAAPPAAAAVGQPAEAAPAAEAAPVAPAAEPAGEMPRLEKAPAKAIAPRAAQIMQLNEQEQLRREAYEQHAKDLMAQGEAALSAKKYGEARAAFREALKSFDMVSRTANKAERQRARAGMQTAVYSQAMEQMKAGDWAGATQSAKDAQSEGHPKALALLSEIDRLKSKPPPAVRPPHRWESDEYKGAEKTVQSGMKAGREFYAAGEFAKAMAAFEGVLALDPQNSEAIRWREKVGKRMYATASDEFASTRADMMAEVRRSWNPRDYGVGGIGAMSTSQATNQAAQIKTVDEKRRRAILDKMDKIIIPEVDFRQANINDVISFLQASSVEFDTTDEGKAGRKGVNIILNLGQSPGAAADPAPAPAPVPAAEGAPAAEAPAAGGPEVQLISFKARDISLAEALRIVTSVAQLKYRVEGNVVMVVPLNAPIGPIEHRSYPVMAGVGERLGKFSTTAVGDAVGGPDAKLGGTTVTPQDVDYKKFFGGLGVEWPDGSQIQYLPSIGRLMVANTADNLAVFEQRLTELNVVPSQIEIEARFVEVRQADLSALGFEWLLTDDWEIAHKNTPVPPAGQERIIMKGDAAGFTKGLRMPSDGVEATLPGTAVGTALGTVQDSVLSIASVLTNPELSMILHLLQQKGNSDLLSAPKVTTQSGQEATIKVVVEYIYPTEFNVEQILADVAGRMVPVGGIVEPTSFETREVGVILQVLPEVSAEGEMISLTLAPEVVSEPEWKDYGTTFRLASGTLIEMPMPQPFFQSRSISTSIVIYNGATVVMGGMITEAHNAVDDQVPLLGDIPLIGRLFRSRSDQSVKRNLLVFVTARLVDPAGRGVNAPKLPM